MPVQITLNKARVPVKVFTQDIEHDAIQQLLNVAQLPIVHGHVAAMPDVHHGIGATVGSVISDQAGHHSGGCGCRHRLRHECRSPHP